MSVMTSGVPELTREKAIELLNRAIEEKGKDYVYPRASVDGQNTCYYVENGAPSCIVGHILAWAGVALDDIAAYEGEAAHEPVLDLVKAPQDVVDALEQAQEIQDRAEPWGVAVSTALLLLDK